MENLLYTCNWQQRELLAMRQIFIRHETTFKTLDKMITTLQAEISTLHAANNQQQTLNDQLQTDVSIGLAELSAAAPMGSAVVDCSPALAAQAKQLEERINHVVASLGDISKFAGASTVSNQLQALSDRVEQRPAAVAKEWKMPNFKIEKFDDYHKTDPLQWWMASNAEADVHHTPAHRRLDALYLQLIGGAQAFMTHMAVTLECTIADLHTKITWEEFEKKWKTRFMVNNDKRHAMNKIFRIYQGQQTSREWLTEWQRLIANPELNLPFDSIRAEFFARSCDALTTALGSEFQYETFDDKISKARELIQRNRRATNETRQQPGYVEKGKGQRTPQVAAVQQGPSEDPAAASTSSDGDVAAAIPPQRSRPRGGKQKAKPVSAHGARQAPWTKFGITEDMFKLRQKWSCCLWCNSTKHITSACLDKDKENVKRPSLKLSTTGSAATSLPNPPESAGLLAVSLIFEDDTVVASSRIEFENYAAELVPPLNQPLHVQDSSACTVVPPSDNELVASPALLSEDPSTSASLEELDPLTVEDFQWLPLSLHRFFANSALQCPNRTFARILARCSTTSVDGWRTCEAVSFDILDTKFDMILGMSWLQSEDHPMNFHQRTVHVRDRRDELVSRTMPLPHPSIGCHVVSAASIRQSIRRNDIEEMGICFLHALPPGDQPKMDTSDPRIIELLDSYEDVFQAPAGVIPDRPIRHGITLEDGAVPPRGCIYRMSEEELQVLRAQINDLLAKGWIRPSCSLYGAPVLFVRKKNKDLRLCIDYKKLNVQTIKNAGPLPRIDDLLERLGDAKYFSKLDLKSGYHQIEIQPRDRYKTAFKTRYGHFEWIVMPFGLTNAPATFQAAMTTEFHDLLDRTVLIYLHDILVYSRTLDEHLEHLRAVLERLRIAKYKGTTTNCPDLKCTTDVRSFLGLASYYMRFVKGFQCIAAPLSRLQSPLVPFEFSDEARHAFHTLKTALLQAPILSIYDPTLPTRVTTDASRYDIGVVLEQHDDTDWHPVEYFSQKVPPINTRDDARKELLAFVTVLKHWRHFLLGRQQFTWATDNNPLTYYKTQDTVSNTIGRWMYFIDQFHFTSKHIPSSSNKAADALSRRPDLCALVHSTSGLDENLQQHFVDGYKSTPGFSTLYADLSSDHPPASNYRIVNSYLLLHTRGKDLLCVPQDRILRTRLLGEYHDSRLASPSRRSHTCTTPPTISLVGHHQRRQQRPFMSAFWTTLMAESGTSMKPSSARHPQTDGQTEREHQTAQMMLRTLIRPDQKDWVDRLPNIQFAYNTSEHPAIGVTPFELHHGGRKGRIFAGILLPRAANINAACSAASTRKFKELLAKARANMQRAQVYMQQQANRRRIPCPIRVGDLVWVTSEEFAVEQHVSRKFLPKWFGPWKVTSAVGDDPAGPSFIIEIPLHLTVHPIFHASKLAVYTPASEADFPSITGPSFNG
ncbi:hypothetical protein CBR_g8558 [Chara braunii]|uniref:Reverse transcriptase domain-containing protein n=1 Tax=Chara braunii TaxID=69332 RepID=A0A388JRU4_CHABU|nr:hypothetical protein CBR_g8558 [Chara braunii]|eukprot:GBG60534.1 hypothetical protein CBR_g8558 [Chara braunii]